MAMPTVSTQNTSAINAFLAQIKAEQGSAAPAAAKAQTLKSLGTQIVRTLEDSFQTSQSNPLASLEGTTGLGATDPLAALLGSNATNADNALTSVLGSGTQTQAPSAKAVADLAAQLAKTAPGPDGDAARAAIVKTFTSGQGSTGTGTSLSGSDLAAALAKTTPGAGGDEARAALVATLTAGQSSSATQGITSLFNYLG